MTRRVLLLIAVAVVAWGCASAAPPPTPPPAAPVATAPPTPDVFESPDFIVVIPKTPETSATLAARYLGDAAKAGLSHSVEYYVIGSIIWAVVLGIIIAPLALRAYRKR